MQSSNQLRAARALIRWDQAHLASASGISVETIKRLERIDGQLGSTRVDTLDKLRRALESAGVEFIPENGGGAGVRLAKGALRITKQIEALEEKVSAIPEAEGPSPEAGMNTMRKALAENDLARLKTKRTRAQKDGRN